MKTEARVKIRSTTILGIRVGNKIAMGGDGQVTMGQTILKANARKIRTMNQRKSYSSRSVPSVNTITTSRS